jgi:predicted anti-sigma-YlaC factor YlaD
MTCDECFEAFSASLDFELPGDEQEAMNEHLDGCPDCQRLRTKLLSMSAEMKGQPFPEPAPEALKAMTEAALAGLQTSRWGLLRRFLRAPYENLLSRHGLRVASFGGVTALVTLSAIARWLLPPYVGMESAAKKGLPEAATWLAWAPSSGALTWAALTVIIVAAWTGGLPALLSDLWSEARLTHRQVGAAALGLALAGPFAALPLLAGLELGAYVLVCCFWTGLCLVAAFALIAFKTPRPLPRLALDFAALVLPLGLLEALARAALDLPRALECQPAIAMLVGSVPFPTLASCLILLASATTLLGSGLAGLIPSYRGGGGRALPLLLILGGLGGLAYGWLEVTPRGVVSPVRAQLKESRQAYLLAAGPENPWLLPAIDYPRLEVDVAGPGVDPRAARLRLASAYLDWDEARALLALRTWADNAPGVTWGLSSFVDSLGQRQGPLLTLPTEERQQAVAHLLGQLRWRVLAESALSSDRGSVSGRIEGAQGRREGVRLRLIEVNGELSTTLADLAKEADLARTLVAGDDLDSDFSVPLQRTVTSGVDGEFEITRVPDGQYVLAILSEQALSLTHNSTIPGVFEVKDGQKVRLEPIRLTVGSQGEDLTLDDSRWRAEGAVKFAVESSGPSLTVLPGAVVSTVVDGQTFSSGTAKVKVLTDGEPGAVGLLRVSLLSKEGRLHKESELELEGMGLQELEIASGDRQGYLRVALVGVSGRLKVKAVKLEVLP